MATFFAATSSLVDYNHFVRWHLCDLRSVFYLPIVDVEESTRLVLGHSAARDNSGRLGGMFWLARVRPQSRKRSHSI